MSSTMLFLLGCVTGFIAGALVIGAIALRMLNQAERATLVGLHCRGFTRNGAACHSSVGLADGYCHAHQSQRVTANITDGRGTE
jgi:hypothetical protein